MAAAVKIFQPFRNVFPMLFRNNRNHSAITNERTHTNGFAESSAPFRTFVVQFFPRIHILEMPSVTLKDVDQHKFVKAFAAFLKKTGKMRVPEWVDIVKSARFKELAPYDPDWFYIRCAALVRHIYIRSPIGVGAVTKIFGGRKRNGTHPSHFCRSAGGVARKALQSLEQLKLIEKSPNGGRKLTSQGRRDLDRIAAQVKAKSKKQLKLQETLVL